MRPVLVIKALVGVGVLAATGDSGHCQTLSARGVLERFCGLDARGEQLTPDGWKKVAALFLSPGPPRRDTLIVVRDFVVSRPAFENGTAEFYVEYVELGRIDLSTVRFSCPLPPGIKVRAEFYVAKQSGAGSGGGAEWRIRGPVPEPHLTVDAAIRFATALRMSGSDVAVRRNVDKTLAALKLVR
jgi:hypothetical protein